MSHQKDKWKRILELQDQLYPGWRKNKSPELFASALGSEAGEVQGVVTHLEGGGTNLKKYSVRQVLIENGDLFVQMVLLMSRYGFIEEDFDWAFEQVMIKLQSRLKEREAASSAR